jgi:hypothetical protein
VSAEHPTQIPSSGLVLSPAETDRLRAVLTKASLTLAVDDDHLPFDQRFSWQLDQAASDLIRPQLRAEEASVRLDVPVLLDADHSARVLNLLQQAAARLDGLADRREPEPYLVGPGYFRQQASAARAWHADLGKLAARQADRCPPGRDRAQPDREDGHER